VVQRRHYRGRVLLAHGPPADAYLLPELLAATRAPARAYRSVYTDHVYCHLGPQFQAIRGSVQLGPSRLVTRIDVPSEDRLLAGCPAPRFWLGPTLFDNYLQTAGTLGVYHNHCFPMPTAIGAVTLWTRPRPGSTVWACATLVRQSGSALFFLIDAFDAEGRLCCRCEDFITRTGRPFSESELITFYEGLTGGSPEWRPPLSERAEEIWT
jgi:Polyketide synthase dehydratase